MEEAHENSMDADNDIIWYRLNRLFPPSHPWNFSHITGWLGSDDPYWLKLTDWVCLSIKHSKIQKNTAAHNASFMEVTLWAHTVKVTAVVHYVTASWSSSYILDHQRQPESAIKFLDIGWVVAVHTFNPSTL